MPILIRPEEMRIHAEGEGWRVVTLADAATIGAPAMVARRWLLEPGAQTPEQVHGDVDQLLYVLRGRGRAVVNGEVLPLEPESMLWLDPGDRYRFEAGEEGLEILQGYAPGE